MKTIKFAPLYYRCNPLSEECYCIGILFLDTFTNTINFTYIKNHNRTHVLCKKKDFGDTINSIEYNITTYKNKYSEPYNIYDIMSKCLTHMIYLHFGDVRDIKVDEDFDYITYITKLFLKFDFNQNERLKH